MEDLTEKQQRFVEEYCIDFNASGAARRAGYAESSAGVEGHRLLKNAKIMGLISKRLEELAMSAAEATARLAELARADFRNFTRIDEQGRVILDLSSEQAQSMMHTIKKLKQTEKRIEGDEDTIISVKTEIELHDAKDAIHKILQAHGAYVDRVDVTSGGEKIEGPVIYLPGRDEEE